MVKAGKTSLCPSDFPDPLERQKLNCPISENWAVVPVPAGECLDLVLEHLGEWEPWQMALKYHPSRQLFSERKTIFLSFKKPHFLIAARLVERQWGLTLSWLKFWVLITYAKQTFSKSSKTSGGRWTVAQSTIVHIQQLQWEIKYTKIKA